MRLSKYATFVENYPGPGQHLTFNWLTQAMVVLDDELRALVKRPGAVDATALPESVVEQLDSTGILVEDEVDEREEVERWHRQVRNNRGTFKAMVMTTYDCNFACTYCVEEGVKRPVKLGDDRAQQIVDWIIQRMEEQSSERLYLNFYGGEPLLNVASLERVAAPLLKYTQDRGLEFDGSITTNGALLNKRNALRLAAVGIKWAKVTLDGDQEAHDAKRPFKGGHGSFDLILRNLKEVWDIIEIRLAGNMDCQNMDAVPKLLDHLEEQGLAEKITGLQFNGISDQAREGFRHGCSANLDGRPSELLQIEQPMGPNTSPPALEGPDVQVALLDANRGVADRGLPARKAIGASLCLLNQEENAVVIDPLGKMYKCPALVGHETFVVGDLDTGSIDCDHLRIDDDELEGCMDCRWFPVCGGGCRFMSFLETGDIRHKNCHKEFYDEHGGDMVKMDYEIFLQERG